VAPTVSAPLRAVLFDWGDTLFHAPHAPEVIVSFARSSGVALSDARARNMWAEVWALGKTPEEIAKGRDLSMEAHRRVWADLFSRFDRVVPGLSVALYERVMDPRSWVPYADTRTTLEAVRRRGLKVGVVSNVPADLRPVFAKHKLDGLVDSFTHSFEVGAEKPDPAIFLAAAKSLGVKPSETLMVGDHEVDRGAERAGMRAFILPTEFDGDVRGLDRVLALLPS
jgi:HAD superfamily hydrolase (TIGR01509 family)